MLSFGSAHRACRAIKIPHRVFFAQQSASWNGGVAFLDWQDRLPDESDDHTWGRMYLITKAQFIDVVSQENSQLTVVEQLFDEVCLRAREGNQGALLVDGWYGRILYLGDAPATAKNQQYPIFTFTCSSDFTRMHNKPGSNYVKTITRGLRQIYPHHTPADIAAYLIKKGGLHGQVTIDELNSICKEHN